MARTPRKLKKRIYGSKKSRGGTLISSKEGARRAGVPKGLSWW